MHTFRLTAVVLAALTMGSSSCTRVWETHGARPEQLDRGDELDRSADFLKCHLKTGNVVVLQQWKLEDQRVSGNGIEYDADRRKLKSGDFSLGVEDVILLETTQPKRLVHSGFVTLGIVTGVSLAVTAACAINPKACFGSCPTFYVDSPEGPRLVAEGFSASIAPAFEETDVDAVASAVAGGELRLTLTNEALETHAIRSARLLVVPRDGSSESVRVEEGFRALGAREPLVACRSGDVDCRELLARADGREHRSWTNGEDLAAVETLQLTLAASPDPRVLVLEARQTLLTTFLFYQLLAYAGTQAGEWLALLERSPELFQKQLREAAFDLGNVEVWQAGGVAPLGRFREVGPLASDVQGVRIPPSPDAPIELELRMTRGNFRLDAVWSALDLGPRESVAVPLSQALRGGQPDPLALAALLDPERHLLTYPGDRFELSYRLPEGRFDVFLESRGYYYEWMRESWLKEESRERLDELMFQPRVALARLATEYQRIERDMEPIFWASRFSGRPLGEEP